MSRRAHVTRSPHRSRAGQATTEIALLSPIMILMLLGTMDFGRLFYDAIGIAGAVRSGLQYATLTTANATDTTGIVNAATQDVSNTTGVTVTTTSYCQCSDGTSINCALTCAGGITAERYVRVKATKTFQTLVAYPGIPNSVNLSQQAVMRVQ